MTNEEAKALFEEDLKDGKCSNDCPECNAREKAISALEKQIPKLPTKTKNSTLLCPNCGEYVGYVDAEVDIRADYCNFCGQAIDWRFI